VAAEDGGARAGRRLGLGSRLGEGWRVVERTWRDRATRREERREEGARSAPSTGAHRASSGIAT
jgi:hypothetical protein